MGKVDKNTQDIDFVITWVDGNDLEWKRERLQDWDTQIWIYL